jgi:hypothetical protein
MYYNRVGRAMKSALLTLILIICFFYTSAQSADAVIQKAVKNLQVRGIDTIVRHYTYYGGGIMLPLTKGDTTCQTPFKDYLIWLQQGKAYIQRFDNCRNYKPIRINPYFIKVFADYAKTIKAEKILGLQYDSPWLCFFKQTTTIAMAHCGYVTFISYIPGNAFNNTFMDYGLEDKLVEGKYVNKNYRHNHNTVIYKLKILIEKQIPALPWPD